MVTYGYLLNDQHCQHDHYRLKISFNQHEHQILDFRIFDRVPRKSDCRPKIKKSLLKTHS